jgi:hypothetical protein
MVEVQPQQLTPHSLVFRGLHKHNITTIAATPVNNSHMMMCKCQGNKNLRETDLKQLIE